MAHPTCRDTDRLWEDPGMVLARIVILFVLAALSEIGGSWLI